MAFTEFYCNASTGSNMNGGSDENASPSYTATNGGWNSGTGVFTPTSGDPSLTVTVGQFAHVFADGSTTPTFIGRVTARDSTTITVSTTAKSGTAPGTSATGISINVGGVWKGPNAAVGFPYGFIAATQVNAAGDAYRVNFKNNASYVVSAAMTHNIVGPGVFEGYTTTPGDGGLAVFDGGTSGSAYSVLAMTATATLIALVDLEFKNNGSSGNDNLVSINTGGSLRVYIQRCVFHDCRGNGLSIGNAGDIVECEAYACNQSNTASQAGIVTANGQSVLIRCVSHDNTGSNSAGFRSTGSVTYVDCIADTNGGHGFSAVVGANDARMIGCDSYFNGGSGLFFDGSSGSLYLENCNFLRNAAYGVLRNQSTNVAVGRMGNCGFGSGTMVNTSGQTSNMSYIPQIGTVTYDANVTPWVDPANGDFRISLTAAKGTGRGSFTQTASSYSGTVGYPDIGAAQHLEVAQPVIVASYRKVR